MSQQQQQTRGLDREHVFVYFPLTTPTQSSLIYGVVRPNEKYPSAVNVYVVSFEEDAHRQLELLGTWNSDETRPIGKQTWIQIGTQSFYEERLQDSFFDNSKLIKQIRQRSLQWRAWRKAQTHLAYSNLLLMMLCDLFLGFCFSNLFLMLGGPNEVLELFLDSVKVIADNLHVLIESLMGAPVGLKLNRPLSMVLGKFFLYHLYLWKTYIDIIKPVISIVIYISSAFGLIGISFQIALLSDLVTMASLHCYCFYVYAARLFGVTLHGLKSTLRMFGGQKWNPLRSRIDSGDFTWDQLCVGMFIFSTLSLLLPTIFVYYAVFLALRLAVLLLQGTLKRTIWLINSLPIYSVILWILNSPLIAGDARFEPLVNRESTLKLVWIKLPFFLSLKRTLNPSSPAYPSINWGRRLNQIISGDLIYPL
uniref:EOG090X0BA1 n=1 Tax=Scapholeberis mucronata TaxID=202097 RepID=A0A4Y7NKP3_9CRUS|nr:EOG090X0BA1 [Scapholeberis mucronata]